MISVGTIRNGGERTNMHQKKIEPTESSRKELIDFIVNLPLFEFLEIKDLIKVAKRMTLMELAPGDVLFQEWEKADFACFIESGKLDVTKKTGPEKSETVATLKRGRSIGEMSIINNFPRSSTVIARSKARLAILPRSGFDDLLVKEAEIGIKILKGLANLLSVNLKKTSSRLADNMLPMG